MREEAGRESEGRSVLECLDALDEPAIWVRDGRIHACTGAARSLSRDIELGASLAEAFALSPARLDALKGITPPEAVLKSTASTSPSDLSWYTTPEGSRIAMIDTQGDATGGAVIAWVIIAGADGFVVNPAQFFYSDGAFTDTGKIQGANPSGHRVTQGTEYQFSIDYSRLSADPGAGKGSGGWVYAPGTLVAVWR